MRIRVRHHYQGAPSKERLIYPGDYDASDARLFGLGEYLVQHNHAEVLPEPEDDGNALTPEEVRAIIDDPDVYGHPERGVGDINLEPGRDDDASEERYLSSEIIAKLQGKSETRRTLQVLEFRQDLPYTDDLTIAEVKEWVSDNNPTHDELYMLHDYESVGKARSTLLDWLEDQMGEA